MNQPVEGDIAKLFRDFSVEINERLVNRSLDESSSEFTVSDEFRKAHGQYPGKIACYKEAN